MEEGKPVLKYETETVYRVNYNDLDRFLSEVYGVNYEFAAFEELGNDTSKEYAIRAEPLGEYDQKRIAELQAKGFNNYTTRTLLTDCCNRGLIPEGRYIINISW